MLPGRETALRQVLRELQRAAPLVEVVGHFERQKRAVAGHDRGGASNRTEDSDCRYFLQDGRASSATTTGLLGAARSTSQG
jgi:hypothetical protein